MTLISNDPCLCVFLNKGADITAENLLLDTRRSGGTFALEDLKGIAMSLLHLHEHGLVHCDFGSHNTAKFGDRWKTLGIGGSVAIGEMTDPKRGFFHPPEAVSLETRSVSLGDQNVGASVTSVASDVTYDIWAYGTVFYEAVAGLPLSPYRSLHKAKRALTMAELFKGMFRLLCFLHVDLMIFGSCISSFLIRLIKHLPKLDNGMIVALERHYGTLTITKKQKIW